MNTTARECRRVENATPPEGIYRGTWGGYLVRFSAGADWYEAKTITGIRTPSAKCRVIVESGEIRVELRDQENSS